MSHIKTAILAPVLLAAAPMYAWADDLSVGDTLVVTFSSSSQSETLVTNKGSFLKNEVRYNALKATAGSGPLSTGLVDTTGTPLSGITLSWGSGKVTSSLYAVSSVRNTDPSVRNAGRADYIYKSIYMDYTDVFGDDIVTGNDIGAPLQGSNDHIQLTISGLTAGLTYDLYMLTGRGLNSTTNTSSTKPTATYTLAGATDLTATLLGASDTRPKLAGTSLISYEFNNSTSNIGKHWALVKWSFTADQSSVTIAADEAGAKGNINAFAISATGGTPAIPEPATATLSLLALAGLCARRRRK